MCQLTDDESSDSSDDFLVPADKINLNSSFFLQALPKPNLTELKEQSDESDLSDNTDDESVNDNENESGNDSKKKEDENYTHCMMQVVKNLEASSNPFIINKDKRNEELTTYAEKDSIPKNHSNILSSEINDLLLQGEKGLKLEDDDSDSSHEEDFNDASTSEYSIPKEGVTVTLPGSGMMFNKKKKKQIDLETILKNRINKQRRDNQELIHKVGLLCWLSYGFCLNKKINDSEVMATALSLVSTSNYPKDRVDLKFLEKFTKWFRRLFNVESNTKFQAITTKTLLENLKQRKIYNYKELVLLFIATLRSLGINCRLVVSLLPPKLKLKREELFKTKMEKEELNEKMQNKKTAKKKVEKSGQASSSKRDEEIVAKCEKVVPLNSEAARKDNKLQAKKRAAEILKTSQNKVENKDSTPAKKLRASTLSKRAEDKNLAEKKNKNHKEPVSNDRNLLNEKKKCSQFIESENDSDSDELFQKKKSPKKKNSPKKVERTRKNTKLLSSDDENTEYNVSKNAEDIWAEVYVESEESWISVCVMDEKIHCAFEIYKKASKPVLYVVSYNLENLIKDVTRRYCPQWLTLTRKQRINEKWWRKSISFWREVTTSISIAEDEMLQQKELEQPLPKTVGECKGHPLYALQRHLLKYEALYPPDAKPLGFLKTGEAIYSRYCVHTLCSRETWLKSARVVKPGQEPYKIVKALPKYDKLSGCKIKDQPLELFGHWQTTKYIPPEAKDGKVPRNEYGNVDLFKQCMLPKGTVHIDLPALNRVARKLGIDCAPAVVGFNFGKMGAVPAIEGYVVCEEYEDTLREAWEEEQVLAQKRAKDKRDKRIYGNWKRLIKGLLIRERLAARYNFNDEEDMMSASTAAGNKHVQAKKTVATSKIKSQYDEKKLAAIQLAKDVKNSSIETDVVQNGEENPVGPMIIVPIKKKSIVKKTDLKNKKDASPTSKKNERTGEVLCAPKKYDDSNEAVAPCTSTESKRAKRRNAATLKKLDSQNEKGKATDSPVKKRTKRSTKKAL
ncbi:DNA repair protein complementing XP-C cells homolog [Prorops nasuta]|uniref:DNA repair protein complementing XP-C cells homolog n=1 Tax=Prorops nasuta TaxID=863751 RepID=UPI0034CDB7A2